MKGKMTDKVKVTCYGETEITTRGKAINFYEMGMSFCDPDSSEYSRYETIVDQLKSGAMSATDEEEDY